MSSKTQCLGKISHQNVPAPARTISARRVTPTGRMALALALAAFAIWRPTWAQGPVQSYAIPAGSLEDALMEFAAQADLKLIFKTDLVRSVRSAGLTGTLTPEQGVARLLEGSGIVYRFVDSNTVTIEPAAPLDPLERLVAEAGNMEYAGATEPAPKKPQAPVRKSEYGPTVLPEMTVTASRVDETSYNVPNATTATKTNTPIMETPVSIQVIPQQVLQDQQAIRVEDAVKNVSGVQSSFNYGDEGPDFFIRGFNTDFSVFRNGFRAVSSVASATRGTANLERIEVLKGPAAVLYGRIEPGGLINLVTKRPLFSPYYSIQQQFGSYDLYRTTLDAAGPLLADSSLAYRFNFEYLDKNSFRDFVSTERIFVAPSLTWRPREDTEVNLLMEYAHVNDSEDHGIPAIGNRPAPLPISRSLVGSNNNHTSDDIQLYLTASHQLNEAWTVRGGFSGYWNDYTLDYLFHANVLDRTLNLLPIPYDSLYKSYAIYLDTTGRFETFGATHDVLLGADYYLTDEEAHFWFGDLIPQDIFNPRVFNFDYAALRATSPSFSLSGDEWVGIYFQDQITLWDKLHLLGGGRYDWAGVRSSFSTISFADAEANEDTRTDRKFSPRVGLLYQPWSWLSLYGNYVESLGSNNGRDSTGRALDPQLATQYEVGAKTNFFDGRLNATLAFYHLTKENLPAADLSTPDPFDSVTIGEARSRGIEFDVTGQITDRVSVIGSYSYIDGEITKDPRQDDAGNPLPGNEGHQLPGAPRHSGSLWGKYALIPERLDVGAGVFAAGQRQGDFANTFQLPGYVRLDAYVAYHWKIGPTRMTAQVNINNLLDKEYFLSANQFNGNPRAAIFPGEPLTVLGSLRLEF